MSSQLARSRGLCLMHSHLGWVVLVCGLCVPACSGSGTQQLGSPTSVKCQTSLVAGTPVTLSAAGGQVAVRVVTSPECPWSATTDVAWLRVDPPSGQGEAPLTLHIAENELPSTRTGAIEINGAQLTLAQAAADSRTKPPSVQFGGVVSAVTGFCPVLTLTVEGFRIETDQHTKFTKGNCNDLHDRMEIKVTGGLRTTGVIYATKVELKK